jgi:hypothetical protein
VSFTQSEVEDIALLTFALRPDCAEELWSGLVHERQAWALAVLKRVSVQDSVSRRAELAVRFGVQSDAALRLREQMALLPFSLRARLWAALPPHHQSLFSDLKAPPAVDTEPPLLVALVRRWVRETCRS